MITYVDTSLLLKLLVEDEVGSEAAEQIWLTSDHLVCAEIGYAEARAALASARRGGRPDPPGLSVAKRQLERLWDQVDVVAVRTHVVRAAGDLAEQEGLRGYDAVHLAAALEVPATVLAAADTQLLRAAQRRGLHIADLRSTPSP